MEKKIKREPKSVALAQATFEPKAIPQKNNRCIRNRG